ncbi:hypothetical protein FRC12_016994 [Ceratobasidium sp. 428]|nr:hypothetical protein FRC12_016994 [Ceratobasidium sp. 428]
MPILWETVNGVHKLLALLPNVLIRKTYEAGHVTQLHIMLPNPSNTNFGRFDYYASLVKHLNVFGDGTCYLGIHGWDLLSKRAHAQTLFPNLLSITVQEYFPEPYSEEQLRQVLDLISPSLVSYWYQQPTIKTFPLRASKTEVMALFDLLIERCSIIKRLAIYPGGSQVYRNLPTAFASQPLSHLRELSGSAALVASDLLVVIGALPRLEYLAIHACDLYLPPLPEELPLASFPALKRLFFSTWYLEDALKLAQLKPLLCQLEFLELKLEPHVADEGPGARKHILALTHTVLSFWLENTVCLRTLYMNVDPYGNRSEVPDFARLPKILKRITELQIQTLHLNGLSINPVIFHNHLDWSHLKNLHLPDQYVSLWRLCRFAALPCLEYLKVWLGISDKFAVPDEIWENRQLRTIESSWPILYSRVFQDVDVVASMLLKTWPNLLEVRCDESNMSQTGVRETACIALNKRIAYMRNEILTNNQCK